MLRLCLQVEVFRRLYEQVGLGWVYAFTKLPLVEQLANAVYMAWAKLRLPVTGRSDLATIIENRQNEGKSCAIPGRERPAAAESSGGSQ